MAVVSEHVADTDPIGKLIRLHPCAEISASIPSMLSVTAVDTYLGMICLWCRRHPRRAVARPVPDFAVRSERSRAATVA